MNLCDYHAIRALLERHGMEVTTAGTGQDAIARVAADAGITAQK